MKTKLTLKGMLLATLCCILITAVRYFPGNSWTSPKDFQPILYWGIVLIGWMVYFLEQFKKR